MFNAVIEEVLVKADRTALRSLSQPARCILLLLRSLSSRMRLTEVQALLEGQGYKCRSIEKIAKLLEKMGLLECNPAGCALTEAGEELRDAVHDVVENTRSFAYKVIEGGFDESDVLAELVTSTASTVGLVEAYLEEPRLFRLYYVLHLYVTGFTSIVLAELSRRDPRVYEAVLSFLSGG